MGPSTVAIRSGCPPSPTERALETLRFFLREGAQWRELRTPKAWAPVSTFRRPWMARNDRALLHRLHAVLIRMVCSRSGAAAEARNVVVESGSVWTKRGGELTGPNPTDRGKPGIKYHNVVSTDGIQGIF